MQFDELLRRFHAEQVHYVVIGGVAAIAQGVTWVTQDLDICYERSEINYRALATALVAAHPTLRGAPAGLPFQFDDRTIKNGLNFTLSTDLGDVDLLGEVPGIGGYAQVVAVSEPVTLYDIPCLSLSIAGLIRAKKAAGRVKDLLHLKELEAIQVLRNEQG